MKPQKNQQIYPVKDSESSKNVVQHKSRISDSENLLVENLESARSVQSNLNKTKADCNNLGQAKIQDNGINIDVSVSSKYEGGSNNISSPSETSSNDSGMNERQVKYNKSLCQRFKNLRGLYNS